MTDAEIKKALECCANLEACEKCPMADMQKYDTDTCEHQIMLYSLDLLNRQQAEIERLKYNLEAVLNERADHSEAIKEFAERLKKQMKDLTSWQAGSHTYYVIGTEFIDNLVKEMVGDADV
jgi:D-mannonate dehydratase